MVACGAAIQAGVLEGTVEDTILLDVIPLSLGIEVEGGVMSRVIERNTKVPTRAQRVFSTATDDQDMVRVHVLQGERQMAEDNRHLGIFELYGLPPAPRGVPQIEVVFAVDPNGLLSVSAADRDSGSQREIRVSAAGGLTPSEVDRLVHEAAEQRQADLAKRERSRILNALSTFVHQCRRTLDERRPEMDVAQQRDLEAAILQLQQLQGDGDIALEDLLERRDALVEAVRDSMG